MSLSHKYAPQHLGAVVGYPGLVRNLQRLVKKNDRLAVYLSGGSGGGKSTIAKALANEVCKGPMDIDFIPGTKCGVERVDALEHWFRLSSWSGGWKAVILDEAHCITGRAVTSFLTLLDPENPCGGLPKNRLVVFTSVQGVAEGLFGAESVTFGRRVLSFKLHPDLTAMATHAWGIAQGEELNSGHTVAEFENALRANGGNLGKLLSSIEAGDFLADGGESVAEQLCGLEVAA